MLGRMAGAHGIKGWVRVSSYTRPPEAILKYGPWGLGLDAGWQRFIVEKAEVRGNGLVAKLKGIDDRDQASALNGIGIGIPRSELPGLNESAQEYYWADLEGCRVLNQDGVEFGIVDSLMETGANDVMIVKNGRERLIPYIDEVIESVDLENKCIKVNWDEDF
jgi:16S rRNA processing protein RimM